MNRRSIGLLGLAMATCFAFATGCRGNDDDGGADIDAGDNIDAGSTADAPLPVDCENDSNIQDVQDVGMQPGTPVALCDVVVTAIDTYGQYQRVMYLQEADGGEYSGIAIFFGDAGIPSGIQVGDLVNVTNVVKDEFALSADNSNRTMTQLIAQGDGPISITDIGDGTIPDPMVVDAIALAASDDEAEKWESVLIQINDVAIVGNIGGTSDDAHANVTGPLRLQGGLSDQVESLQMSDCLVSVVGVLDYFFNYQLMPRSADDITTGGTNCLPPEEGDVLCGDSMDNDYNGFTDCVDFQCINTVDACTSDTSIVDIQNGTVAEDTAVSLTGVVVSGITGNRQHLWIMDDAPGGPYNGIYVYRGGGAEPLTPDIEVGAIVNVTGVVIEFNSYTELTNPMLTPAGANATPVPATGVDTGTLANESMNEPYEGTLVQLSNVRVSAIEINNFNGFTVDDGSGDLVVGTWSYDYATPTVDQCFATLTGVIHRFSAGVSFSPRSAEDMVDGGDCN